MGQKVTDQELGSKTQGGDTPGSSGRRGASSSSGARWAGLKDASCTVDAGRPLALLEPSQCPMMALFAAYTGKAVLIRSDPTFTPNEASADGSSPASGGCDRPGSSTASCGGQDGMFTHGSQGGLSGGSVLPGVEGSGDDVRGGEAGGAAARGPAGDVSEGVWAGARDGCPLATTERPAAWLCSGGPLSRRWWRAAVAAVHCGMDDIEHTTARAGLRMVQNALDVSHIMPSRSPGEAAQ